MRKLLIILAILSPVSAFADVQIVHITDPNTGDVRAFDSTSAGSMTVLTPMDGNGLPLMITR